jgi:hypothetical protein
MPNPSGKAARRPRWATIQKISPSSPSQGRAPRLPGAPPGRLQQSVAGRRDTQPPREQDYRVDHPFLERIDEAVLD